MSPLDDLQRTIRECLNHSLIAVLRWIARNLPPHTPPPVELVFLRHDKDTAMPTLVFALKVKPPVVPVLKRSLTLIVNGVARPSFEPVDGDEVKFGVDDIVVTSLVDTSLAGVDSEPGISAPLKVSDRVPPATPDAVELVFLRSEPEPEPEPDVDPTPAPEETDAP